MHYSLLWMSTLWYLEIHTSYIAKQMQVTFWFLNLILILHPFKKALGLKQLFASM